MRAAAMSVRGRGAGRVIVAVPIGSLEACAALEAVADEVVCLAAPASFGAVGYYYRHFEQVEDAEVARLLGRTAGKT
jgi:putative phosphoribosyl transferase